MGNSVCGKAFDSSVVLPIKNNKMDEIFDKGLVISSDITFVLIIAEFEPG
jgi:hypothetical protein